MHRGISLPSYKGVNTPKDQIKETKGENEIYTMNSAHRFQCGF